VSSLPRPSQKDKILQAALECFAELGYDATRVRHVAQRAGVSDAALYRHYPSMQALAEELYARHFSDYATALDQATAAGTTEERLRRAVRVTLATYRADPAAFTFALLRTPTFMPSLPAGTDYPVGILAAVIAAGQERGEVRAGTPKLLAAIFIGCILRPIIVASLAAPGSLDLLGETEHDQVIEDAAVAALTSQTETP
jgi:AcrR family transcriptional regulator